MPFITFSYGGPPWGPEGVSYTLIPNSKRAENSIHNPFVLVLRIRYCHTEHMFTPIYADDLLQHARLQDSRKVDQDALNWSARFFAETCEAAARIDVVPDDSDFEVIVGGEAGGLVTPLRYDWTSISNNHSR